MTVREFSDEFDLLYNNVMSNQTPGLDDYEKSVFLTKAQEEIVTQLYNGSNADNGFESSELIRRYLSNLLQEQQVDLTNITPTKDRGYYFYKIPYNLVSNTVLAIIAEQLKLGTDECFKDRVINVVPTRYDEINKILYNPFRRPNWHKALRMDLEHQIVEIISKYEATLYYVEYIKKPAPIVLTDLSSTGLAVDGVTTQQTCALDSSLHRTILDYAVKLAAASWASNNKK